MRPTAQSVAGILTVADPGFLGCRCSPYPHLVPAGLAPDLQKAWGWPNNQIKTIARCSLNQEARKKQTEH